MKILFFKPHRLYIPDIKEWSEEKDIEVEIIDEKLSEENIDRLKDSDGLVLTTSSFPIDGLYEKIADYGIKQIALTSVGYDEVDLDEASEANLIITNTPDYSPESMAEFTLMMILKALRHDKKLIQNRVSDDFRQKEDVLGETLMDKTVGIYGLGRIGLMVAKYAHSMGARVIAHSQSPKPEADGIVKMVDSYDKVLERSDIIAIHSALSDDNYHFFDKKAFEKMKDGVILVNCARGGLVDNKALLEALDRGKVGFAGLDVLEDEELVVGKNNPKLNGDVLDRLINHQNVDFYPHISYFTTTSMRNQARYSLDSVVEVLENGDSENRVN